jgi:hypothetical protein
MRKIAASMFKMPTNKVCFGFGGGAHHEIDYHAVVTKNPKSGTIYIIQAII